MSEPSVDQQVIISRSDALVFLGILSTSEAYARDDRVDHQLVDAIYRHLVRQGRIEVSEVGAEGFPALLHELNMRLRVALGESSSDPR